MELKFRGAVTFDDDESLEKCLQEVDGRIGTLDTSFLTMEHIEPLGLHVTVHHSGKATTEQVNECRDILNLLAGNAYSGYVDMEIDGAIERYHAKEIDPKEVSVEDIANP